MVPLLISIVLLFCIVIILTLVFIWEEKSNWSSMAVLNRWASAIPALKMLVKSFPNKEHGIAQ